MIEQKDFFDLTWAYMLKCEKENIVHAEIFFDPQVHTERGIKFDLVIDGIHKAILKAEKELGDKFDIRYFHDEVLCDGGITLPILENKINSFIAKYKS